MATTAPIIKEVAWISLVPQLIFMSLLVLILALLKVNHPFSYGAFLYLGLSFSLRLFIPITHRKGIVMVKKEKWINAIEYFEKSYVFFKRYNWIDKYRYLTLLSSSKMCYKEMALINIAYCYGQTKDAKQAENYYRKALEEYPYNKIAIEAIDFLKP